MRLRDRAETSVLMRYPPYVIVLTALNVVALGVLAQTISTGAQPDSNGSGLTLLDDQTEPGVQVLAEPEGPVLKLYGENGEDLLLTP